MSGFRGFCRLLGVAGGASTVVLLAAQNSKDDQFLKSRFLVNAEADAKGEYIDSGFETALIN